MCINVGTPPNLGASLLPSRWSRVSEHGPRLDGIKIIQFGLVGTRQHTVFRGFRYLRVLCNPCLRHALLG